MGGTAGHGAPAPAKSKPPASPIKQKGPGLYSAGGRVYRSPQSGPDWVKSGGAEAARQWQVLQRAGAAKPAKSTAKARKQAPPPPSKKPKVPTRK